MRCFLPAAVADLGEIAPAIFFSGAPACADTAALRRALPDADDEERELVASLAAADYSALAYESGPARRVVLAADAAVDPAASPQLPCDVTLSEAITWDDVVAILIDEEAAEAAVRAAAGDADALASLEDFDLLWYDVTERGDLAAALQS
ncbi:hypothetical protein BSZ39_08645 [Bowdeniella nasicola]|uniref:Uncharacterized protein n=1 Tax=Bowdeniella nasicola TaxID=208480 RepID=A0A1Q5Q168_9ACTO|nr:hypothetical protein [Bowdeniella nasicola]OKL53613.1 hypothetical protein BSZ39_08645 [Bowdeniella nasicola]